LGENESGIFLLHGVDAISDNQKLFARHASLPHFQFAALDEA
jgi:hypothetical protein